jgi:hypothetical protein
MKVDIFVHVKAMILTAIFFIKASKSHPYKTSFINLARHPNGNETISKIDLIITNSRILLTYSMRELSDQFFIPIKSIRYNSSYELLTIRTKWEFVSVPFLLKRYIPDFNF